MRTQLHISKALRVISKKIEYAIAYLSSEELQGLYSKLENISTKLRDEIVKRAREKR
jgi:hypothetical protein